MKDQPGFCYDIFKNQAFWNFSDGSVGYMPCSVYNGHLDKDIPPEQSWRGENRRHIINIVAKGEKVSGCKICYDEESVGRTSRRMSDHNHYENFLHSTEIDPGASGPESLDYSVGNLCNLKCVICNPGNSSAWIPDYRRLYPDRDLTPFLYKKDRIVEIKDPSFLNNIKSLHFHGGGEPLMSMAHVNLLQKIKEVKGLSDVRVYYNTNGTQQVNDDVMELWAQCRLVELYFSIDDIGTRFEYQRTGAKWSNVRANIEWFKINMPHNHLFNVTCTWSYLNLFYLDELVTWHRENFSGNRYGDPCHLVFQKALGVFGIKHLGNRAIEALMQRFDRFPMLQALIVDMPVKEDPHTEFWQAINSIDKVRSSEFKKICPEWTIYL